MAAFWTSLVGVLVIAWTLRETFRDLFQPSGSGSLSSIVGKGTYSGARRMPRMLPVAGPLSIVVVICCWALLVVIGFGLIYWSRFPHEFNGAQNEATNPLGRIWGTAYFSVAALTTLGCGNLIPHGPGLRILSALESLIGISLVTASITWIVLIYPALGRMRALARSASTLQRAHKLAKVEISSGNFERTVEHLAHGVIRTRVDLVHFPLVYYFHVEHEEASMVQALRDLTDLADEACSPHRPDGVRLSGAYLQIALADMAHLLVQKFVHHANPEDPGGVFSAVAQDLGPGA